MTVSMICTSYDVECVLLLKPEQRASGLPMPTQKGLFSDTGEAAGTAQMRGKAEW